MTDDNNSWAAYQKMILAELERLGKSFKEMDVKIDADRSERWESMQKLAVKVAMLEVKCGMWGALGGIATGVGTALLSHLGAK